MWNNGSYENPKNACEEHHLQFYCTTSSYIQFSQQTYYNHKNLTTMVQYLKLCLSPTQLNELGEHDHCRTAIRVCAIVHLHCPPYTALSPSSIGSCACAQPSEHSVFTICSSPLVLLLPSFPFHAPSQGELIIALLMLVCVALTYSPLRLIRR